jgi:hypothetical protein
VRRHEGLDSPTSADHPSLISRADMLVYTRREQKSSPAPEPEPPALAVDAVEKLDAKYMQELEEYLAKYVQVRLGSVDESDRCS